jgi:hypothetical protein
VIGLLLASRMIGQACRLPEIIKAICQPEYTDYTDWSF